MTKHPTCNDLPEAARQAVDLGLQLKQAHWNVKGPHLIGLHELFDKSAQELEDFIDNLAERAVELGGTARGTIQVISKASRLPAYPLDLVSGLSHVCKLTASLAAFAATTRAAIAAANESGDADTADLFTEVSRGIDKMLWMVEAHSCRES